MKKQSFVMSAAVLTVSLIICKILGGIYKIPLTNILGTNGMGLYYLIFPVFALIISLSGGLPAAISKIISEREARGEKSAEVLRAAVIFAAIMGGVFTVLLIALSHVLASVQNNSEIYIGYIIIAPAVFFVSILSAIRGYFQGKGNMTPTAVSQIIEQVFKLLFGFLFAIIFLRYGVVYGACGALLGVTISEIFACFYIVIHYRRSVKRNKSQQSTVTQTFHNKPPANKTSGALIKQIFIKSLPFMIGSVMFPLALMIDSFLIVNLLDSSGIANDTATTLFGINSGIVSTMITLPTVVSLSLAAVLIPSVAYNTQKGDIKTAGSNIEFAVKISLILLLPCALMYLFFAPQILGLLFNGALTGGGFNQYDVAALLLQVSGIAVLMLGFLQLTTAILQGLGRTYVPVIGLGIGIILKIGVEIMLVSMGEVNILGAAISNIICFTVPCIINISVLRRQIKFKIKKAYSIVICNAGMIAACMILISIFNSTLGIVSSFVIAAMVYLFLLILSGVMSKSELKILLKR